MRPPRLVSYAFLYTTNELSIGCLLCSRNVNSSKNFEDFRTFIASCVNCLNRSFGPMRCLWVFSFLKCLELGYGLDCSFVPWCLIRSFRLHWLIERSLTTVSRTSPQFLLSFAQRLLHNRTTFFEFFRQCWLVDPQ